MILLTRLGGPALAINADLIQRAEQTPETLITLVDGTKLVVAETVQEVIDRFREFQASVIAASNHLSPPAAAAPAPAPVSLRIVKGED